MKSKKIKLSLMSAVILLGSLLLSFLSISNYYRANHAEAAGTGWFGNVRISASPSSTSVGGSISFMIHAYDYRCTWLGAPDPNQATSYLSSTPTCFAGYGNPTEEAQVGHPGNVTVTGSGNTLSATSFVTDGSGNAQITLSSSVAEAKTFSVYRGTTTNISPVGSATVTFNSVSAAAPQPVAPRASTSIPQPSAAPAEPAAPDSPAVNVSASGKPVEADKKPIFKNNQPIMLSGQTVPNGVVTIYVFSEPKKYTVTADKDGKWTYRIVGLPTGSHHIEAEVTDPSTGKTSVRAQILVFSVEKAAQNVAAAASSQPTAATNGSSRSLLLLLEMIVGGIALVFALATAYLWKFKRATFDNLLQRLNIKRYPSTK